MTVRGRHGEEMKEMTGTLLRSVDSGEYSRYTTCRDVWAHELWDFLALDLGINPNATVAM